MNSEAPKPRTVREEVRELVNYYNAVGPDQYRAECWEGAIILLVIAQRRAERERCDRTILDCTSVIQAIQRIRALPDVDGDT